MAYCKQCGAELRNITGKVQKQFCSDTHRKAYKRANLAKSEATASPSVDELRTDGTKQPRTSTADNSTSDSLKRGKYIDEQGNAHVPDKEFTKLMAQAGPGHVRVSKPGDADYVPQCETTRALMDKTKDEMIQDVARNGGEYTYLTVKGKVQDVHHRTAEDLRREQRRYGQGT